MLKNDYKRVAQVIPKISKEKFLSLTAEKQAEITPLTKDEINIITKSNFPP